MSEGRDGRAWKSFAAELRLVMQFFQSRPGAGGGSTGLHSDSRLASGMGNRQVTLVLRPLVKVVGGE